MVGGDSGMVGKKLDQRRNQKHCVGPVPCQDLQEHLRVKRGQDDLGCPVAQPVGHDDVQPSYGVFLKISASATTASSASESAASASA